MLEAAMAGVPLVLSDIATFRGLWEDAALFVSPDDPDAAADAIARLHAHAALRCSLANAARRRARRYQLARMVSETLDVYVAATEGRPAMPARERVAP